MWLSQWAGIHVITTYMVTIFQQSGSSVDPQLAPIIVSCIQQALALLAAAVLRVSPRKVGRMSCWGYNLDFPQKQKLGKCNQNEQTCHDVSFHPGPPSRCSWCAGSG